MIHPVQNIHMFYITNTLAQEVVKKVSVNSSGRKSYKSVDFRTRGGCRLLLWLDNLIIII